MTKEEYTQYQSLDDILQHARLTPMFQPIVSHKKNKIYGYEALIRGPSDRHGNEVFYPLLALSIGAVKLLGFDSIKDEADLAEYATKAKSAAKK